MPILDCGVCPLCGEPSRLLVSQDTANRVTIWKSNGRPGLVQDVFADLSAGERETILSGSHTMCFDEAFAE